jgi:hypothetical protein
MKEENEIQMIVQEVNSRDCEDLRDVTQSKSECPITTERICWDSAAVVRTRGVFPSINQPLLAPSRMAISPLLSPACNA